MTVSKRIAQSIRFFIVLALGFLTTGCDYGVLSPKGLIASDQRVLLADTLALMLIVVLPVIIMSFAFAYRYRESHKKHHHHPNWSHNTLLELFWWGIPTIIIVILGILTWKKTHHMDPYRRLPVAGKAMPIQAVALRWKWLFIYPTKGIATVNYVRLPVNKPVQFFITADAPMSSFFIPRLGSQIYAMAGMRTRLNLYPTSTGVMTGMNSQYNGNGFSDMKFKVEVTSAQNFNAWAASIKENKSLPPLSIENYKKLLKPTIAAPAQFFHSFKPKLFKLVMKKYMTSDQQLVAKQTQ